MYFIISKDGGAPKIRGTRDNFPLIHRFDGPGKLWKLFAVIIYSLTWCYGVTKKRLFVQTFGDYFNQIKSNQNTSVVRI